MKSRRKLFKNCSTWLLQLSVKVFAAFSLKSSNFPSNFSNIYINYFTPQKHKKHIKFHHASASILPPIPTPKK